MKQKNLTAKQITQVMEALSKSNPSPKTELIYANTYQLLVAVVLSAQATDVGVNKATVKLFSKVKNPKQMVKLTLAEVEDHVKSIGLFRTKAKNVLALSQQLIEKHEGVVPNKLDELEALPGVGRKTANVVLNCAFGKPTIAVDTHVYRVANRTGIAFGKNPREVEDGLLKKVPKKYLLNAHHWFILHGRYTCVARKPKCQQCPVNKICTFLEKTPES